MPLVTKQFNKFQQIEQLRGRGLSLDFIRLAPAPVVLLCNCTKKDGAASGKPSFLIYMDLFGRMDFLLENQAVLCQIARRGFTA